MDTKKCKIVEDYAVLPAAVVNVVVWVLFFVEGYPLGEDLNFTPVGDIGEYLLLFPAVFLLTLLVAWVFRAKTPLVFAVYAVGAWFLLLLVSFVSPQPFPVPGLTSPSIKAGLLLAYNPWAVILVGVATAFLLVFVAKERLEVVAKGRASLGSELVLSAALTIVVATLYARLRAWGLDVAIGIGTSGFLLVHALRVPDFKSPPLEGHKPALPVVASYLPVVALVFVTMALGVSTVFYFTAELGLALACLGVILGVAACEAIYRLVPRAIPWAYFLLGALVLFSVECTWYLDVLEFSDSTYVTNPPILGAPIFSGVVLGLVAYAVNAAYMQYKVNPHPGDVERSRVLGELGRFLLLFGLVAATIYGFIEGLGFETYDDGTREYLLYGSMGATVLGVVLGGFFLAGFLFQGFPMRKPRRGQGRVRRFHHVELVAKPRPMPRQWVAVPVILVVGGLCGAFIPQFVPARPGAAGYPNYLGQAGSCTLLEASPLTKVGRYEIARLPLDFDPTPTPTINRSIARNEFESIQVVISNWGATPVEVTGVEVRNSTQRGLPAAFAGEPVNKTWKGTPWEWARFTPHYVTEIQEGYPDLLYELYGTQRRVQFVAGENQSRPLPVVQPGQTLALWFTVYAGEDLLAGEYSDEVVITTTAWTQNVTLLTRVWNFTLPVTHSMRTAIGNRRAWDLENRDAWTQNFLQHRISPYFPSNDRRGNFTLNGTEVVFNFTTFEQDVAAAVAHGLDSFRVNYKANFSKAAFTPAFNATILSFYSQLGYLLGNHTLPDDPTRTWLDLAIVYAIDEPNEGEYAAFNKWSDLVHRAHPGWRVLLTEQVEEPLEGHVDIWVPHMNSLDPAGPTGSAAIATQHAAGREYWYYTCCSHINKPTVSFVDPAVDHRALFWTAWAFGYDGYLFWDANAYINQDLHDPLRVGYDGIGDAIMLLHDGNLDPVTTIVWETMRDGLEDVEYFTLLENDTAASHLLAEVRGQWSHFVDYERDATAYHLLREQVGTALDQ